MCIRDRYWHRWHMTLGDWCRNYIFYPLSISKCFLNFGKWLKPRFGAHISKVLPGCIASVITFIVIGVWHGANMKYLYFGLWNGIVITVSYTHLIPQPSYVSYVPCTVLAGGTPVIVELKEENDFRLTAEELEACLLYTSRCV